MTCERPEKRYVYTSATGACRRSQVIVADRGEGDGRSRQPRSKTGPPCRTPGSQRHRGAYGHSRIRNLIIGSTTTEMIRSCKIPIVLFR